MSVVVSLDGSPVSPATNIICLSSGISTMRLYPSAISTSGGGIEVSFNNDIFWGGHSQEDGNVKRKRQRWVVMTCEQHRLLDMFIDLCTTRLLAIHSVP